MGTRALSCALSLSVAATVTSIVGATAPASADPAVGVTLVAASNDAYFGQIEWHAGAVYSVRDNDEMVTFPADGSAPAAPASTTPIPFVWHGDGNWQSDREAFVVARDGSVYLRSPGDDGWGIGRLDADGTVIPVTPPPGSDAFHGSSESLVIDPEGDSVYLGGARDRADGYTYGVVGRLPLPAPADQQAATETVVSADTFVGSDTSTHHHTPFLPADNIHGPTQAFITNPAFVDVRGGRLYFDNARHAIERMDLDSGAIQTVAGSPWAGGDPIRPEEGMLATTPYITLQAGPVVDRAGNIFFSEGDPSRFTLSPGIIWEIRASDGTLHQVAGGGADDDADTGDDPLSLALHPIDLELDPDGNLYVSDTSDSYGQRRIVRLNGVAAADTAPGAPAGLTADSGYQSLVVSWQAPVDDGGQPVTSYTVRLHPSGVAGTGQDVVRQVTSLTSTFTDLLNDTSYDVSVRATNGRGDGPDATVTGSPADYQATLAALTAGTAPYAVTLDASGSRAPAGATYQFFCGDRDTPTGAAGTTATASCTYSRGSSAAGWQARVVMRDPGTGRSFESTRPVVVEDQPDTIEGSSGFPTGNLVVDVPAASDGSLTSDSCGAGSVGATCRTVDGARIVLTAAPGTFSPTSHVRIYRGDAAALQSELGSDVQVQNGFAITWTPKVNLTQPLLVNISPAAGGRQRSALDLGGFFSGMAQAMSSAATTVANTVGSAVNAAANAVGSAFASLWAAATQNLVRPNNSATNDVVMCRGEWRSTLSAGWSCSSSIMIFRGVPTERITSLDAGSGVVAAGGANVVAAGGANAVAAGGLNLLPAAEPGQVFQLNANSVVASGGLNVIAPGGANIISDNGLGVVASGGANVVASGGLNLTAIAVRDPGFAVVTPGDPTPPTVSATLDPAPPSSGVYPAGTTVQVHVSAAPAAGKSVQKVHADTSGAQLIPHTVVAGSSATVEVSQPGTTTVSYGATDDQLAEAAPGTVEVRIAAPATVRSEQTVTFGQPVDRTYGAVDGLLQATSSSGLPVTLTSLSTDVCTLSGATVHVVAAGTCRVEAGQPGDADRLPAAPVVRTFTVTRAPLLVTASNAVMVPKGKKPQVGATYTGFVAGDDFFDLAPAAQCSANPKSKVTSCAGAQARNYTPTYQSGKVARSKTGYAIVSAPVVQGRRGAALTLKVVLDGGSATLTSKGGLPPGVKVVSNKARTKLAFVGVPTTAGTWRVKLTASANGKVAGQTVTFVIA